jgi:2-oxoglutarate ferredoxin oxidoreductase subunit alpha
MQARWGTHGDHPIIALVPNSVAESYELTIRSFNLSEKYRIPVVLLLDEIIGHVNEKVELIPPKNIVKRKEPDTPPDKYIPYKHTEDCIPPMASYGKDGYRFHVTGLAHNETGFPTNDSVEIDKLNRRLDRKMQLYRDEIVEVETHSLDDAEIGIFAYGSVSRAAQYAVRQCREEGIKVGLLRPRTLWPFPDRETRELADKVDKIIVPELNLGQIAHEVEWAAAGNAEVIPFGRVDGLPIRPAQIVDLIKEAASKKAPVKS